MKNKRLFTDLAFQAVLLAAQTTDTKHQVAAPEPIPVSLLDEHGKPLSRQQRRALERRHAKESTQRPTKRESKPNG